MRKAVDKLLEYALVHDLGETAAMTGVGTLIHAANGMDPEEAAIAAAMGFGTGMVTRPFGRAGGNFVGKQLDNALGPMGPMKPGLYTTAMNFVPGSRQAVAMSEAIIDSSTTPKVVKTIANAALPVQKAAHKAFNQRGIEQAAREGRTRGLREEDAALLGRFFSDNLAGAAMYLVGPAIAGNI